MASYDIFINIKYLHCCGRPLSWCHGGILRLLIQLSKFAQNGHFGHDSILCLCLLMRDMHLDLVLLTSHVILSNYEYSILCGSVSVMVHLLILAFLGS